MLIKVSFFQHTDSPGELLHLKRIRDTHGNARCLHGFDKCAFVAAGGFADDKGFARLREDEMGNRRVD